MHHFQNVLAFYACKIFMKLTPGGLYHKNIMIVNSTSRVVRMTIVSDAPSCGVTYDCHSDDSRGVISAPREHL
jgi:hypothetical protein